MRSIWTGGISFGLIYIPVKMYSATEEIKFDLDLLCKDHKAPIRYARIDKQHGEEVPWKDVVKGYEIKDGDYVLLDKSDFEKANMKKAKTIDIEYFVDADEIDPKYFEKPYYLEPNGADKTYALLVQALKKSNKVGVAEFVLRNRESLSVLKPDGDMLILNKMRYADEIRSTKDLEIPKEVKMNPKEMEMAVELVEKMTEKFNIKDFKDDYIEELQRLIKAKSKNKVTVAKGEVPKATEVSDLMDQLKKSLETVKVPKL